MPIFSPGFAGGLAQGVQFGVEHRRQKERDEYDKFIRERQLEQQESQFGRGLEHTEKMEGIRNAQSLGRLAKEHEYRGIEREDTQGFEAGESRLRRQGERDVAYLGRQSVENIAKENRAAGEREWRARLTAETENAKRRFALERQSLALQGRGLDLQANQLEHQRADAAAMRAIQDFSARTQNKEATSQAMTRYWAMAVEGATENMMDPNGRPVVDPLTQKPRTVINTPMAILRFKELLATPQAQGGLGMTTGEVDSILGAVSTGSATTSAQAAPATPPSTGSYQPGVRVGQPGRAY